MRKSWNYLDTRIPTPYRNLSTIFKPRGVIQDLRVRKHPYHDRNLDVKSSNNRQSLEAKTENLRKNVAPENPDPRRKTLQFWSIRIPKLSQRSQCDGYRLLRSMSLTSDPRSVGDSVQGHSDRLSKWSVDLERIRRRR